MYAYEKPKSLESGLLSSIPAKEKTAPEKLFGNPAQSVQQLKPAGESTQVLHDKLVQRISSPKNNTGLPDSLKSGIESLSGFSMDSVRVHYNSSKPAQLNAYAYTQGTEIHVAPGQEKHLPHEAWHVVQQMQGRVKPTLKMNGVNVNDNQSLEREATVLGAKANSFSGTAQLCAKAPSIQPCVQCELKPKEIAAFKSNLAVKMLEKEIKARINAGKEITIQYYNDKIEQIKGLLEATFTGKRKPVTEEGDICTDDEVLQAAELLGLRPPKPESTEEYSDEDIFGEDFSESEAKGFKEYRVVIYPDPAAWCPSNYIQSIQTNPFEGFCKGEGNDGSLRRYYHVEGGYEEGKPFWCLETDHFHKTNYVTIVGLYAHINDKQNHQIYYKRVSDGGLNLGPKQITLIHKPEKNPPLVIKPETPPEPPKEEVPKPSSKKSPPKPKRKK